MLPGALSTGPHPAIPAPPPDAAAAGSPRATATQTRPSPSATERGVAPSAIVASTRLLAGSIRLTLPVTLSAAHTPFALAATLSTPNATGIVRWTGRGPGSIRHTTPA